MQREATIYLVTVVALTVATLAGQGEGGEYRWDLPPGVPPPGVPADAPMTAARVELGRYLFYDTRLSGNGTQSCATCHRQALAFTDGRPRSVGSTGDRHPRSSMSLANVAYRDALTWANPTLRSLEEQALVPMFGTDPVELGLARHEVRVRAELAALPIYQRSLAAFQRSIVSFRSAYDRHRFDGDEAALSASARRGMGLFFSRRTRCGGGHLGHTVTTDLGLNLDGGSKAATSPPTDPSVFMFHNTGLYNLPGPVPYPADNTGKYAHTGELADAGRFRIPTLRNVAVTAPYMHDGSIATLDEVLDHYVAGGRAPNPRQSESIQPLALREDERLDLVAFLYSLTDEALLRDPRWSDPWGREP